MPSTHTKDPSLPPCHICGGSLDLLPAYSLFRQVTSDCRPWQGSTQLAACHRCGAVQKALTQRWHDEVAQLYAGYAVYAQAQGGEQMSFDAESGANRSRSQKLVSWLKLNASLPESGMLLDIGCGNGSFLQAFQRSFPGWRMVGAELDDRNRTQVESIPGVHSLHTGQLARLTQRFDLIVMVHALEHMPEPIEFLAGLHKLLTPTGKLLFQVPDLTSSPFDILITDHCTHFSQGTLRWVVESAGYEALKIDCNCVAKELTVLARCQMQTGISQHQTHKKSNDLTRVIHHLHWLQQLLEQAQQTQGDVGIFGSSISSTWLASQLGERVRFFIDEDVNRVGNRHLGRPILSVEQAPSNLPVLLPLRPDIARALQSRLGYIHPNLIIPPAHPSSLETDQVRAMRVGI